MQSRWLLFLLQLGQTPQSTASPSQSSSPSSSSSSSSSFPIQGSPGGAFWYDWGWYGLHPEQHYESFGASPLRPYILQQDERCSRSNGEYLFVGPRGLAVTTPGPIVYDTAGHLVWMDTRWGEAMDVKVQRYRGADYLTFWHGSDNGTFGEGQYYMLNASYEVAYTIRPAASGRDHKKLGGDLHDFVITKAGTALMTVYQKIPYNLTEGYDIPNGWIIDSMFQEVDIATGRLVFEWHASDHFTVHETLAPLRSGVGRHEATAFDFFHINSVGKTPQGDYVLSSRYMCAVACVSGKTGDVQWQLGGRNNDFEDLSGGEATNMHWQHHAVWHADTSELTVFDNGAYDSLLTASHSRGLRISLDIGDGNDGDDGDDETAPTAELVQAYIAPQRLLAPSQGSVQLLDKTKTVLVGWGYIPAYTEFAEDGTPLCDVHLCPVGFYHLGWCKNYRTFKHHWVGRPSTLPSLAMRPKEGAVYVSWNGATEVRHWQLQTQMAASHDSNNNADNRTAFTDLGAPTSKDSFEARLVIPPSAQTVRIAALDKDGRVLAYSAAVSTTETTVVAAMFAPPPKATLRSLLYRIAVYIALGVAGVCAFVYLVLVRYRAVLREHARILVAATNTTLAAIAARVWPTRMNYRYEALPTTTSMAEVRGAREGRQSV